jgi:GTP diphosphokinase / guanosine-3',5'-bis(diphosphate) 3'-diphosphatase
MSATPYRGGAGTMTQSEMATLEFELPEQVEALVEKVRDYLPSADTSRLVNAYLFAEERHHGQYRKDGTPYITHPLAVAHILADLQMGVNTITAGLLHDVLEDTGTTPEELEERFGATVRRLVEGVTKLHHSERQFEIFSEADRRRLSLRKTAENLRRLLVAVSDDLRVMIIKLADRLHNMQTLDAMPPDKQLQIATETLHVYSPLAHRLGIWQIKSQLDDLAFKYLYPEEYREISQWVARTREERQEEVRQLIHTLKEYLWERGIRAEVMGRPKHLWSIFKKIKQQHIDFGQVYDLIALRVLVETVEECYLALGMVHRLWTPVPGLFADYIASPKPNGYRSLHTKVIGPDGKTLEIQIRTWEMHQIAEYGIAAHWRYKEGEDLRVSDQKPLQMPSLQTQLRDLTNLRSNLEFLASVLREITSDEVLVMTPKGDLIDLPAGATPIDFAYRIHTEVGHRCVGARVNGRMVPLNYKLQTGDRVEIITRPNAQPSYDWLGMARTASARSKIRAYFRAQRRAEFAAHGRALLERELERTHLDRATLAEHLPTLLQRMNFRTEEDLYASIGEGLTSAQAVIQRLRSLIEPKKPKADETKPERSDLSEQSDRRAMRAMQIEDADGYMTRRASCCHPLPGDELLGYVSRGRGIIVHRASCPNLRSLEEKEPERIMRIEWVPHESKEPRTYPTAIRIETTDRVGVLADITAILSGHGVNISTVRVQRSSKNTALIDMVLELQDARQLRTLFARLQSVEDIIALYRTGGRGHHS